jgi:VIT1/CCC1 family predicted Fe2+/Mn2+ transporter
MPCNLEYTGQTREQEREMSENKTGVDIEPVGNGLYQVTQDGKPKTGPLTKTRAIQEAERIERGNIMYILLLIAAILGVVMFFVTKDFGQAFIYAALGFLSMGVVFLLRTR